MTEPTDAPAADPRWDWVPVTDGSTIAVGDFILWTFGQQQTVATTVYNQDPDGTQHWAYMDDQGGTIATVAGLLIHMAGGVTVPLKHPITERGYGDAVGFRQVIYEVIPKPAANSKFVAPDGSKWIYPDDANTYYYCWKSGTTYQAGAVFMRPDMPQLQPIND